MEFYSTDKDLLYTFYHRVIALSAPVKVIITSERGGIDPLLIERFRRIFGNRGEVFIRRAFKAEDLVPTIEAMDKMVLADLIIIDPYHHHKRSLYDSIVSAIRRAKGSKKFIFSFMDREKEGSIFGLHSVHSIIELKRGNRGFKAVFRKSTVVEEVEIPYSFWEIFGMDSGEGLLSWIV